MVTDRTLEMERGEVCELISSNAGIVFFGSQVDAVDGSWIEAAERRLGLEFSPSYL